MNTNPTVPEPGFDSILASLIEAEEQSGDQSVDIGQWTDRYPEFAEQIRSFFINRGKLEAVIGPRGIVAAEAPTIGSCNKANEAGVGPLVRYIGDYELHEEI